MAILLSARDVTKRFGGLTAVNKLNVNIEENSIHSIISVAPAATTRAAFSLTGFGKPRIPVLSEVVSSEGEWIPEDMV